MLRLALTSVSGSPQYACLRQQWFKRITRSTSVYAFHRLFWSWISMATACAPFYGDRGLAAGCSVHGNGAGTMRATAILHWSSATEPTIAVISYVPVYVHLSVFFVTQGSELCCEMACTAFSCPRLATFAFQYIRGGRNIQAGRPCLQYCSQSQYEKPDIRKLAELAQLEVTDEEVSPITVTFAELRKPIKISYQPWHCQHMYQTRMAAGRSMDASVEQGDRVLCTASSHRLD